MINKERYSLVSIIAGDLLQNSKLQISLLVAVLISAILVVNTTHQTRLLTTEHEQIVLEKDELDIEWRNLILEENVLGDQSRIEHIAAEKLQMHHVNPLQENIVVYP